MLSKREKLFAAVSDLHGLICPVCRQLLSRQGDNLILRGRPRRECEPARVR